MRTYPHLNENMLDEFNGAEIDKIKRLLKSSKCDKNAIERWFHKQGQVRKIRDRTCIMDAINKVSPDIANKYGKLGAFVVESAQEEVPVNNVAKIIRDYLNLPGSDQVTIKSIINEL